MLKILGLDVEVTLLNIPISFESELSVGCKKKSCCPNYPPSPPEPPGPPFPPYPPFANRDA
ncbi:hypothetical protein M3599_04790 [Niallia circulans]|uniref:hypothetical protein n=1 Tax=Niallia circulans TaxID=1397 RepID=UPI0020415D71|nr:hypothetical protein [Niallia circulans]MCM2980245.1 hypothetical protein [Niallia circulans]